VDVGIVYDFDRAHPDYVSATVEALETKWRPRATKGVADHSERTQVDAGFLEVEP
jgi:hypothetical protein